MAESMKKSIAALLDGLDNEQRKAVTLQGNGVVAAGAGSGKTRVLASRYAWLVMEKKLKPEEILALTFTNKAVGEMYSRIYRYLLEVNGEQTSQALKNFHKARISTLDSFSANVARTAAARYGISPDFKSDDLALKELAREAALKFVLDHREDAAIRQLLSDYKLRTIAEEIFAEAVLRHSPISSPLLLDENLSEQKEWLKIIWKEKVRRIEEITANIIEALHTLAELNKSIGFTRTLEGILLSGPLPVLPDIGPLLETAPAANNSWDADMPALLIREQIKKYFGYYSVLIVTRLPSSYGEVYTPVVDYFRLLKGRDGEGLYQELDSIANYALNFGLCAGIFELVKKFQDEFNAKKRESSLLSFNDIARLAVDALRDHPDIRKVYKDSLKMIMIDEFQDNNALQRDLVYLLAENPLRTESGLPAPGELEKDRLFFVGDEKQSIYRFRGADVAVFRSLARTITSPDKTQASFVDHSQVSFMEGSIELIHNYRSLPGLIAAFNSLFGGIFLPTGAADYEASYSKITPPEKVEVKEGEHVDDLFDNNPLAHFCFLNGEDLPRDDPSALKSQDLEAVFIAAKIRDMVQKKETILRRTGDEDEWVECNWEDFAVLQRSYTHQSTLEKYFREFGIPYNTDRPSGLFNEAPILDLLAYLRLLVYPEDRIAYAALIRSPFMRLSDLSLTVCLLGLNGSAEPFDEKNEAFIPQDELELYRRARERYRSLCEASRTLPLTELVTKLWFEEAYRYETLWTDSAQVYEGLFDLFFSLASDAEARGKNLAGFIEYVDDVMKQEEKPDDKDIPGEGGGGVRIMSIHKAKGLEFPVVFIFDCTHAGNIKQSKDLISYHEKYGLILKIPQAEELPLGGNYFQKIIMEEEIAKDTAELRRLLYVAMTRAECRLFLTFTLPKQTLSEKREWDASGLEFTRGTLRRRLAQLDEKQGRETFLKLLTGVLPDCPSPLCSLEVISVLSRAEISSLALQSSFAKPSCFAMQSRFATGGENEKPVLQNQKEAAIAAVSFYGKASIIPEGKAGPASLNASKLTQGFDAEEGSFESSPLDSQLKEAGLSPAGFGSLVHAVLEGRLKGQPCLLPSNIRARLVSKAVKGLVMAAGEMADCFLASELGKRCGAAGFRESEFSIVTSVEVKGKVFAITGQIDLVFMDGPTCCLVDFKTDKTEDPEKHFGQLAAYLRAVTDIYGMPVKLWLYYLRSGRAIEVTEEVKALSLEEVAEAALAVLEGKS